MAAISSAHLEYRYSGGASNNVGNNSLGGIMSSFEVLAQTVAYSATSIAGISLRRAGGHSLADIASNPGTLAYTNATNIVTWDPPGAIGVGPNVTLDSDGKYALFGANGQRLLVLDVTFASLPGSDASEGVNVTAVANELFDDITAQEAFIGDVEYRCVYVTNVHPTSSFIGVKIWIPEQPVGADDLAIGLDPAGVGNGSTTGVATTIANEDTAPAGVTFSSPSTQGTGLSIIGLAAGEGQALWIRRTVPAGTATPEPNDESRIATSVAF